MDFETMLKKKYRTYSIEWFYGLNNYQANYKVQVTLFNRVIYTKILDKKHYTIYFDYINERVKYLIEEDILNKDYNMILLDNTMYRVIDETENNRRLLRALIPIGAINFHDIENQLFDLVLDCTLRTGEVFDETDLVYHNGIFYNNGMVIGDIRDFDRDGIEYERYDLLNGLSKEQKDYLFYKIYYNAEYNKIENYITKHVNIKIR
jgi:hypothetical protein